MDGSAANIILNTSTKGQPLDGLQNIGRAEGQSLGLNQPLCKNPDCRHPQTDHPEGQRCKGEPKVSITQATNVRTQCECLEFK